MWFGANATGLDSPATLALIARHRVGAYGWQQGTGSLEPGQNLGEGDVFLASAATHLSDFLDAQPGQAGSNRTLVAIYRQVQVALRLFAAQRAMADNALFASFWMRDGRLLGVEVVSDLVAEAAAGVRAVFFDESDQNMCGYWNQQQDNCGPVSLADLATMQQANYEVLARTTAALNAAGIIPIFSFLNCLTASGDGIPGLQAPCALPEDSTLAALAKSNLTFARFYQNFLFSWWTPGSSGADVAAGFVANAILEGAAGVPLLLHSDVTTCPASPRNITRPGRLGGPIELNLALFLVVQTEQTVFSISGKWYDDDFC